MNLVRNVIHGEVLPPGASVHVVGRTHPLRGGRIVRDLEAGLTIEEMLEEVLEDCPEIRSSRDLFVCINGHPIEERNFGRIRPKPGTTVNFIPTLKGGNTLKTILGLVVAVAALVVAPWAGGFLAAALSIPAGVASAFVAGGISPIGPISLNALWDDQTANLRSEARRQLAP